ncbi:hypothetical protein Leryth_008870 [Lithospermum erythrorhizon]|nr:hypothetical protein Leryth_008870 [Lithospermum erythrorhizon]
MRSLLFKLLSWTLSVGLHIKAELEAMVERMEAARLHTIDLTDNDLVKDHMRHLVMSSLETNLFLKCFVKF